MSEPFLAEIRIVGFNFAPRGWAQCDGQILPINQNQSLFSLLGTTYGGDGGTTFGLPDLRGRTPIHFNSGNPQGRKGGEDTHSLSTGEVPQHTHTAQASSDNATERNPSSGDPPTGNVLAAALNLYTDPNNLTDIHQDTVANAGGGQSHENMQPFLVLNFVIALQGLFPSL